MAELNPNAQKLVDALRSGEYKQTQSRLRESEEGESRFCCLGVACDLYAKEHPEAAWIDSGAYDDYFSTDVNGSVCDSTYNIALPPQVQDWLGFKNDMGEVDDNLYEEDGYSLAGLNDSGRYSFEKIADVIESKPKGLFT